MRELEEKLRERDLELQQLRENLDENEAAICQVRHIDTHLITLTKPSFKTPTKELDVMLVQMKN